MKNCSFRVLIEYVKMNSSTRTIIDTNVSISELTPLFQEISEREDFVTFGKIEFVNMWDDRSCSQIANPGYFFISDNENDQEDEKDDSSDFITKN